MENKPQYYIYQHVPKCAGQSFRVSCRSLGMHLILEKPPQKSDPEAWAAFVKGKVDFSTIEPDTMICGHLIHDGVRPRERYAEEIAKGNVHILTLLRDPMERAISAHFYRQRQGKIVAPSVEAHLKKMKNPIAHHLGFPYGEVRDFLKTFYFVAVAEHLQTSLDVLAKLLGRPPVTVPRVNVTPRKPYEVSEEVAALFKQNNQIDYALYRDGIALLKERYAGLFGQPFPENAAP